MRRVPGIVVAVVLLSGCTAGAPAGHPSPVTPAPLSAVGTTAPPVSPTPNPVPVASTRISPLVGAWAATGRSVPPGTVLVMRAAGLTVVRACGFAGIAWIATTDGQFALDDARSFSGCHYDTRAGRAGFRWLERGVRFRLVRKGWVLLDARGAVLAAMRPATTADRRRRPWEPVEPLLPNQVAALDRVQGPLPPGARPVTAAELVGRWATDTAVGSVVEFAADGTYTGHDRWLLDAYGGVVVTATGPTWMSKCWSGRPWQGTWTSISWTATSRPATPTRSVSPSDCENVRSWFRGTRVAYTAGGLVLYDPAGHVVHRLVRRD